MQARRLGAEIVVTRQITRIDPAAHRVHLDGGDVLRGRTIILACGVAWRKLDVDGFDELAGKGIFYGAARSEAPNTHGLDIHLIGAGNSAGQAAMFFSSHAKSVTILYRGDIAREEHVDVPDRADRDPAEHRRRLRDGGRGRARRRRARVDRRFGTSRAARRRRSSRAASSSSSARTPRRSGSRRRSRSTRGATSSPAAMSSPRSGGSSTATRTSSRRACRGSSRAATCGTGR